MTNILVKIYFIMNKIFIFVILQIISRKLYKPYEQHITYIFLDNHNTTILFHLLLT